MKSIISIAVILAVALLAAAVFLPPATVDRAKRKIAAGWTDVTQPKIKKKAVPNAVERLARERGQSVEKTLPQFDYAVATAPRFRVQGRVVTHLPDGHVFLTAHLLRQNQVVAANQTYALFGHPDAEKLKPQDQVDCFVCSVGADTYPTGGKEFVTAEELVWMPPEAAEKPGAWIFNRERGTLLDRR